MTEGRKSFLRPRRGGRKNFRKTIRSLSEERQKRHEERMKKREGRSVRHEARLAKRRESILKRKAREEERKQKQLLHIKKIKKPRIIRKDIDKVRRPDRLKAVYKEVKDPATGLELLRPAFKQQIIKDIPIVKKPITAVKEPIAVEAKPEGGIQVISVDGKPVEVIKPKAALPAPVIALLAAAGLALTIF